MKLHQRFALQQLVAGSLTGALLCYACTWLQLLPLQSIWSGLPIVTIFALGAWASIAMESAIKKGIADDLWSADSIEKQRQRIDQTQWTVLVWALVLLHLLYFVYIDWFSASTNHSNRHDASGFAFFWLYPLMVRTNLLRTLRPRPQKREIIWNAEMKPVVSEHWGQRS